MAAYPSFYWSKEGTTLSIDDGMQAVRATNGKLKVRNLYTADKRDWQLSHWLTTAQRSTLDAFYAANKLLDVTFTSADDGATYTVRFVAAPIYQWQVSYWVARVHLKEV